VAARSDSSESGTTLVLAILSCTGLILAFSESMLIPALPVLQTEFHTTEATIAWVPAIYLILGGLVTPTFGKLGDHHGKKKLLLVALLFYTVAVVGNGFAWSVASLLVFRAVQGIGLAMFPLTFSLIRDDFPPERVPLSTGIVSAMFGVGGAIGLVGGGWITQNFSWQTNYHLLSPVAVLVTLLVAWQVRESPLRCGGRIDLSGAILLGIALLGFLVALTQGDTWGWTSAYTLGLFAVGIVFTVLLVYTERRVADPFLDLTVKGARYIYEAHFLMFIGGFAIFFSFVFATYLASAPSPIGFGFDTLQATLTLAPAAVASFVAGPLFGRLVRSWGAKNVLLLSALILDAGFLSLLLFRSVPAALAADMVIVFFGAGGIFVAVINVLFMYVPLSETGTETALNTVFRFVGAAVGPTIVGALLTAYAVPVASAGESSAPAPAAQAFFYAALAATALGLIGVVIAYALKKAPDSALLEQSSVPR